MDHEVVHRDLELLDPEDPGNIQILDLDVDPEDPAPHQSKDIDIISSNRVLFQGVATVPAPEVDGVEVQVTDLVVSKNAKLGLAVANTAGPVVRGALQILDLKDARRPELAAEVLLKDSEYASVELLDRVAYALGNDDEGSVLDIYDLTDLDDPRFAGRLALSGDTALASCLDDEEESLWVVTGVDGGLHRIDIDNPLRPRATDFTAIPDARHVARGGDRMFVLHGTGVRVLDEDGSREYPVRGLPGQAPSRGVVFQNRYYVNTNEGVELVDPRTEGTQRVLEDARGTANGLATDNGQLFYRANGEGGLQVLRRSWRRGWYLDPVGTLDVANAGSANSAATRKDILFSGDGRGGVLICTVDHRILGR